jgi:hypothetical protein
VRDGERDKTIGRPADKAATKRKRKAVSNWENEGGATAPKDEDKDKRSVDPAKT